MARVSLFAATGALALLLAACGGDGKDVLTPATTSTPEAAEPSIVVTPTVPLDRRQATFDNYHQRSLAICIDSESGNADDQELKAIVEAALRHGDQNLWQGTWLESEPIDVASDCPGGPPPTVFGRVLGDTSRKFSIFVFLMDVTGTGEPIGSSNYEVVEGSVAEPIGEITYASAIYLSPESALEDSVGIAEEIHQLYGSPRAGEEPWVPSWLGQESLAICVDNRSGEYDNYELRDIVSAAIRYGYKHYWGGTYLLQPIEVVAGCPTITRLGRPPRMVDRLSSRFALQIFALTAAEQARRRFPEDQVNISALEVVSLGDSDDSEFYRSELMYVGPGGLRNVRQIASAISLAWGLETERLERGECRGPHGSTSVDYCEPYD